MAADPKTRACAVYLRTGKVPVECLFNCQEKECPMRTPDVFDRQDAEEDPEPREQVKCRRCGSTDVRWRQQNGRWAMFSLQPGVLHQCKKPSAKDDFK